MMMEKTKDVTCSPHTSSNSNSNNNNRLSAGGDSSDTTTSSSTTMSPDKSRPPRRSVDEMIDMLCPICEEACSCNGQVEPSPSILTFKKSPNNNTKTVKRSNNTDTSIGNGTGTGNSISTSISITSTTSTSTFLYNPTKKVKTSNSNGQGRRKNGREQLVTDVLRASSGQKKFPSTVKRKEESRPHVATRYNLPETKAPSVSDNCRREELDAQYALSEYYFSDDEGEGAREGDGGSSRKGNFAYYKRGRGGDDDDDDDSVFDDYYYGTAELIDGDDSAEAFAEYYGYSSGSDIAIESLFLQTSESDNDDSDKEEGQDEDENDEGEEGEEEGEPSDNDTLIDELKEDGDAPIIFCPVELPNGTTTTGGGEKKTSPAGGSTNNVVKTNEESLGEQLAKITPQILAAISMAAKNLSNGNYTFCSNGGGGGGTFIPSNFSPPPITMNPYSIHPPPPPPSSLTNSNNNNNNGSSRHYYVDERERGGEDFRDTSLRLEELMDTKKLALILSTSPPTTNATIATSTAHATNTTTNSTSASITSSTSNGTREVQQHYHQSTTLQKRMVPIDAFRRSRRNSIQTQNQTTLIGALRQNSFANCTLAAAPSPDEHFIRMRTTSWSMEQPPPPSLIHDSSSNAQSQAQALDMKTKNIFGTRPTTSSRRKTLPILELDTTSLIENVMTVEWELPADDEDEFETVTEDYEPIDFEFYPYSMPNII